jgi:hypothetical protein
MPLLRSKVVCDLDQLVHIRSVHAGSVNVNTRLVHAQSLSQSTPSQPLVGPQVGPHVETQHAHLELAGRCHGVTMTVPDGSSTYTRKGFLRSTTNFPPRSRQCSADLWTPPPPPVQHAGTVVHPATHSCHEHCCCWSWRSWWPTGQRYRPPPPPPTRPESPMSDMPLQDPRAPLDIPRLTLPASQHSLRPITVPIP